MPTTGGESLKPQELKSLFEELGQKDNFADWVLFLERNFSNGKRLSDCQINQVCEHFKTLLSLHQNLNLEHLPKYLAFIMIIDQIKELMNVVPENSASALLYAFCEYLSLTEVRPYEYYTYLESSSGSEKKVQYEYNVAIADTFSLMKKIWN